MYVCVCVSAARLAAFGGTFGQSWARSVEHKQYLGNEVDIILGPIDVRDLKAARRATNKQNGMRARGYATGAKERANVVSLSEIITPQWKEFDDTLEAEQWARARELVGLAFKSSKESPIHFDSSEVKLIIARCIGHGNPSFALDLLKALYKLHSCVFEPNDLMGLCNFCADFGDMQTVGSAMKWIKETGQTPSNLLLSVCVKGYGRQGNLPMLDASVAVIRRERINMTQILFNIIVDAYVRCNALDKADKYLRTYEGDAVDGGARFLDVVTYTSYMRGLALFGDVEGCFNVMSRMESQNIQPSSVTLNTLIDACINARQLETAEGILTAFHERHMRKHDQMKGEALVSHDHTHRRNSADRTSTDVPNTNVPRSKILELVKLCEGARVMPSVHAYTALAAKFAGRGQYHRVLSLFAMMTDQNMKRDTYTDTVLLTAYVNAGELTLARAMLDNVYSYPAPDRPSMYTAFISALSHSRSVTSVCMAYDAFRDMIAQGIVPHKRTVCALINSLTHLEPMRVKEATYLFEIMDQLQLTPDSSVYCSMLKAYSRLRAKDSVAHLFDRIRYSWRELDVKSLTAFMMAAIRCDWPTLGLQVFEEATQVRSGGSQKIIPDVRCYNILISTLKDIPGPKSEALLLEYLREMLFDFNLKPDEKTLIHLRKYIKARRNLDTFDAAIEMELTRELRTSLLKAGIESDKVDVCLCLDAGILGSVTTLSERLYGKEERENIRLVTKEILGEVNSKPYGYVPPKIPASLDWMHNPNSGPNLTIPAIDTGSVINRIWLRHGWNQISSGFKPL